MFYFASKESKPCAVKSKYFTGNSAMDDNLSDFQEPKKSCAGPRKAIKPKNSKLRKALKKPRGQKDIRSVLKSTKQELESYSRDFNKVCKKAGIDVNTEELQLAIALSKSLQENASNSHESGESSQTATTQERIGKIRSTLQEYGFKVPEVKISGNTRKNRKHKKYYKLIQTTETEKKEIIADKYSQILFQNITHCTLYCSNVNPSDIPIYSLASNVSYEILRTTNTFCVDNLLENTSGTGYLLRDWSTIPGRPVSPRLFEPMHMSFSEIECSQEELDSILSGTLKTCKDIVSIKIKDLNNTNAHRVIVDNKINVENRNIEKLNTKRNVIEESKGLKHSAGSISKECRSCSPDMFDEEVSDIFDDSKNVIKRNDSIEIDKKESNVTIYIMDLTQPVHEIALPVRNHSIIRESDDLMELTECIKDQSNNQTESDLSRKTNVTKRISNDFMEITECLVTLSQPLHTNNDLTQNLDIIEENTATANSDSTGKLDKFNNVAYYKGNDIDLTVSPEIKNANYNIDKNSNTKIITDVDSNVDNMDLTQSSNTSDELPLVSLSSIKNKILDDTTIIIDSKDYAHIIKSTNSRSEAEVQIDLTQHRDYENDVQSQSFFQEYNHDHSESAEEVKEADSDMHEELPEKIDLTQSPVNKRSKQNTCLENSGLLSQPRQECQIILNHVSHSSSFMKSPRPRRKDLGPESSNEDKNNCIETANDGFEGQCSYLDPGKNCNSEDDIDLTQNSDTSDELVLSSKTSSPNHSKTPDFNYQANNEDSTEENDLFTARSSLSCNSIGKNGKISIDYDDIINNDENNKVSSFGNNNIESLIFENSNISVENIFNNISLPSNSSQNSEVFDISDKELYYSLHQSRLEIPKDNFVFGGISIMNDFSDSGTSKKSIDRDNNLITNDVILEANVICPTNNGNIINKCNEISPIKHRRITEIATPQKVSSAIITVTTPKNSELIIKTNNVTPMMNYESMSTPDIHKELDKYGIKPFKRKRGKKEIISMK